MCLHRGSDVRLTSSLLVLGEYNFYLAKSLLLLSYKKNGRNLLSFQLISSRVIPLAENLCISNVFIMNAKGSKISKNEKKERESEQDKELSLSKAVITKFKRDAQFTHPRLL